MTPKIPEALPAVELVGQTHEFKGYAFGLRQPSLLFAVRLRPMDPVRLLACDQVLSRVLSAPLKAWSATGNDAVLERVLYWSRTLLDNNGHPMFAEPRIQPSAKEDSNLRRIAYPCLMPTDAVVALKFTITAINRLLADPAVGHEAAEQALRTEVQRIKQSLSRSGLQGFNPTHFLHAANELGIPWLRLVDKVIQFGQGARSRWMDSSFTDATPNISTQLARNKKNAAMLLRQSGLPVPEHFLADSEDAAVSHAEKLGYPVVIKPANLDGGKAVAAHLVTEAAVRKAWTVARKVSPQVLVEKHVTGRDYRIQVVLDEVQGVLERVPGGVTGNDRDTVRILLDTQNEERRTATGDLRYLHAIKHDEEAEQLLAAQSMSWDSIPEAGRVVRLRGAANVTSGGVPVPIPIELAHPDNLALARRAVQTLRLDVAGIDLLIPDIGHSWLESGAYICEVNAQPQMFTTMHLPMLRSLIQGDGRIPILTILGADCQSSLVREIVEALRARGQTVGVADCDEVMVDGVSVAQKKLGTFAAGQALISDKNVDVAILCICDSHYMRTGLPVDSYDVLLLASYQLAGAGEQDGQPDLSALKNVVNTLLPACMAKVIPLIGCGFKISANLAASTQARIENPIARDQVVAAVAEELMAANERHRSRVSG